MTERGPGSLGSAEIYREVGSAYRAKGDLERALEHLEQALAIYDELRPAFGRGHIDAQ